MKKILMAILIVVMSVSCVFAITGCKQDETVKATITYVTDGGSISSTTQEVDVNNFTLLIPTKEGYEFKHWEKEGGIKFTNDSKLDGDITLKAVWEVKKFNVTFDVGTRGTISTNNTLELNAVGYSLPQVTCKPGATFVGWTLNGEDFDVNSVLTSNITLVAKYNVTGYTVYYVYAGGELKRNGESVDLPNGCELLPVTGYELPIVERNGYTFEGWINSVTGTILDSTTALTDDCTLTAKLVKNKYKVVYFNTYEDYFAYISSGELIANTYQIIEDVAYGADIQHVTAVPVNGKTHTIWKGCYVDGQTSYTINNFAEGVYMYEGNVYVYPEYEKDVFVVKYESGATANFGANDFVETEYFVLDVATATLGNSPVHEEGKDFIKWVYNNGTTEGSDDIDVADDAAFRAIIANAQKGDTFVLTAVFDENDYVVYRIGDTTIKSVVSATGVNYDVTDIDLTAHQQVGYHIEWFIGNVPFAPFSFAEEADLATVVIDAKLIKNEAKLIVKVWGPENDATIGEVEGAYSYELDIATGDVFEVATTGKLGYTFLYFTTEAWTATTANAPQKGVSFINANNEVLVAEDGATLVVYAYFYNSVIS